MNDLEFLMMQVLWFLYHIRYYTITFSTKHNSFLHAVTGSSSGLLLLNIVSLWFGAVEVTEAEVVAAAGASGCGCWPELVKLAAVCCNVKETTFRYNIYFCMYKIHTTCNVLPAFIDSDTYSTDTLNNIYLECIRNR